MKLTRIRGIDEFQVFVAEDAPQMQDHLLQLETFVPSDRSAFTVPGYSYTAKRHVNFRVDFRFADGDNINWREHVNCPITHFNNRMRSTIHLIDLEGQFKRGDAIYLTEQVTPMYAFLKKKMPKLIGSEFIGDGIAPGTVRRDRIRHEDVTQLSFADASLDAIISLDVYEHVPNYQDAFHEAYRTLKPGGRLIWSVPFAPQLTTNLIRAQETPEGIVHFCEPEYHGNPMSDEGSLCFTHFGWEMLDNIRSAGFRDAYSVCFYSMEYGYLGGYQHLFFALK